MSVENSKLLVPMY